MTFVELNGFRTHYDVDGPAGAPVLVLGHSIGASTALWDSQLADLCTTHCVLRVDFRGHGGSAAPPGPYTMEMLGRDMLALADALSIESFDYAGVSLGGLVGQWLGAKAPHRVRRIVLANTAACIGTREHWDARMAGVTQYGMASIADAAMQRWFSPAFIAREPARVALFKQALVETSPDGYVATCIAIRDADHRALVGEITRPTLVVAGEVDAVTTRADATWLAEHIPGAQVVTLPAAHLANVEAATDFNQAVLRFLSSSEG